MKKILAVIVKQRRITYVCPFAFFENWLAAFYFLCRLLFSVWSAAGRRILLVKLAQVRLGAQLQILKPIGNKRFNPLNIKSLQYIKDLKITHSHFLGLDLYLRSTRAQFYLVRLSFTAHLSQKFVNVGKYPKSLTCYMLKVCNSFQ